MNIIGIIPARFSSTRLPGKPLEMIGSDPMVWHVYRNASLALGNNVWVATDDRRIFEAVNGLGGRAVMTSTDCPNGSARCLEAIRNLGLTPDIVINIQGDEPFMPASDISRLIDAFREPTVEIATLARRFDPADGFDALFSPDIPKVTFTNQGRALYFSRSIIPYVRDANWQQWLDSTTFHIHIGMYAFSLGALEKAVSLPHSHLEQAERLEQLRWLENGMNIRIEVTDSTSFSVDTPADLEEARQRYDKQHTAI